MFLASNLQEKTFGTKPGKQIFISLMVVTLKLIIARPILIQPSGLMKVRAEKKLYQQIKSKEL